MHEYEDDERGFLDVDERPASSARGQESVFDDTENLLLDRVDYQIIETAFGRWRRFMGADLHLFEEFTSHVRILGLPLLHFTRGRSPETGKRITAKGIIAVGRFAIGVVAIGQVSAGLIAIGQLGLGLLAGFGQATCGVVAVGQLAIGCLFGLGQVASGYAAIGQFAIGEYVIAQFGVGTHVLDSWRADPAVLPFFRQLLWFL